MNSRFFAIKFVLFILLGFTTVLQAQQNPISVNVNVLPPYSKFLSDYVQGSEKVVVTLVNNSIDETYRFKLRWRFSGNNDVEALTELDAMPKNPILLGPGETMTMAGTELRTRYQSFSRGDIDITGIDLTSNLTNQTIPEGVYHLCARAYQYETNEPLSAEKPVGCSQPIRISIVDPPKITNPQNETKLTSVPPQFINFNWIPVNVRNANIRYRFKIVDITGADISPYDAMKSQNFKVYETDNLKKNFFNYDMSKPLLEDGHRYAVRVQAYDRSNQIRIKNSGKSEIHTFTYHEKDFKLAGPGLDDSLPGASQPPETPSRDTSQPLSKKAEGKGNFKCGSNCKVDISNIPQKASSEYSTGDTIMMGHFKIALIGAVPSAGKINGVGAVTNANFLKNTGNNQNSKKGKSQRKKMDSIPVLLENVQVNKNGRAFAGKAQMDIKKGMIIGELSKKQKKGSLGKYLKKGISLKKLYNKVSSDKAKGLKNAPVNMKNTKAHMKTIELRFLPTKATISLIAMLEIKDDRVKNKYMTFASSDLCVNPQGLAISEQDAYLHLKTPVTVNLSDKFAVTLLPPKGTDKKHEKGTYLNFDCNGFRDIQAYGAVKFSRSQLKPLNKNGEPSKKDTLAASFSTAFQKWDNWIAELDFTELPPQIKNTKKLATERFEYNNLPGYKIHVEKVYMDHSLKENLTQKMGGLVTLPVNISSDWVGIYMSDVGVELPEFFSKKKKGKKKGNSQNRQPYISGSQMILDPTGISGSIYGTSVIDSSIAGARRTPLTIDTLDIKIKKNLLLDASMKGDIKIPSIKNPLPYDATINTIQEKNSYNFNVETDKNIRFPMWLATAQLDPNSSVNLNITGRKINYSAVLNGRFTFDRSLGKVPGVHINDLKFQDYKISNNPPYITINHFGVNTNLQKPEVVGKPTNLKGMDLRFGKKKYNLNTVIDLRMNMNKGMSKISGETELRLYGMIDTAGKQGGMYIPEFTFQGAEIDSVRINADFASLHLDGSLDMYKNDPTFGSGFDGDINMTLFGAKAFEGEALFGSISRKGKDDLEFWYADGMGTFYPLGAPFVEPFSFYGIGGGAYHNLEQTTDVNPTKLQNKSLTKDPNIRQRYTPKAGVLGLKATTIIGLRAVPFIINSDATLKGSFQENPFSVKSFGFNGDVYTLTSIRDRKNSPMKGSFEASYAHKNREFSLSSELDIQIPPQAPIVTGKGNLDFYVDGSRKYWYLHFGKPPEDKMVSFGLGFKNFNLVEAHAYFMAGKKLISPSIPNKVSNYLGGYESSLNQVDLIKNRKSGFATGLRLESGFDIGGKVVRAEGDILAGADITLTQYDASVLCNGRSDYGLNRWYAMGQGYFYGNLGFFVKQKEILGTTAGSIVEVGLPDPAGLKGQIKADLTVLGKSLVFNQKFTMGSICDFEVKGGGPVEVESPVEKMQLISNVTPENHKKGIDLFVKPTIKFSKGIYHDNKITFTYSDGKGGTKKATYRFDISYNWDKEDETGGWDEAPGIQGSEIRESYNRNKELLTLSVKKDYGTLSTDYEEVMLEGNTRYRLKAKVEVMEKTGSGQWKPAKYNIDSLKGQKIQQTVTHIFTTGDAPDFFPDKHIAKVVPARRQRYFTQGDYDEGYVKFSTNITPVWDSLQTEGYEMKATFEPINQDKDEIVRSVQKHRDKRLLNFDIPKLQNETIYRLKVVARKPPKESSGTGTATSGNQSDNTLWSDKTKGKVQQVPTGEVGSAARTEVLFTSYFRTSQYNTLKAKINDMEVSKTKVESKQIPSVTKSKDYMDDFSDYDLVKIVFKGPEPFGYYDLSAAHEGSAYGAAYIDVQNQGVMHQWHSSIDDLLTENFCVGNRNTRTGSPRGSSGSASKSMEVKENYQFTEQTSYYSWNSLSKTNYKYVRSPLTDSEVGLEQSSGNADKNFNTFQMPDDYTATLSMGQGQKTSYPDVLSVKYYGDLNARVGWEYYNSLCFDDDRHYLLKDYPEVSQGSKMYIQMSGYKGTASGQGGKKEFTVTLNP